MNYFVPPRQINRAAPAKKNDARRGPVRQMTKEKEGFCEPLQYHQARRYRTIGIDSVWAFLNLKFIQRAGSFLCLQMGGGPGVVPQS